MTVEEILQNLKSDLYSYQEYMDEMIINYLKDYPEEKEYWEKWFKGELL